MVTLIIKRTEEERRITLISMLNAHCRDEIAALERTLQPLHSAFDAFEREYAERIGPQAARLEAITARLRRVSHYAARIVAHLEVDPQRSTVSIFSADELREIGRLFGIAVPDEWFPRQRPTHQGGWAWADKEDGSGRAVPAARRPRLSPDDALALKAAYLELARQYHPDLATSPEERQFRDEMMLRINAAWHDRNISALVRLRQDVGGAEAGGGTPLTAIRLAWAEQEHARLLERREALRAQLRHMRASRTFPLWFDAGLRQIAFRRRQRELEEEIAQAQVQEAEALAHLRAALFQWFGG